MVSKQLLLGIGLVVGGGALVGILNSGNDTAPKQDISSEVAHPKVEPLKQDIQTERHLSEQKKKERENNTLAQEQQAKQFVEEQERAKQQQALTPTTTTTTSTTQSINASVNSVVSEVSAMLPADMQQSANTSTNTTNTNTEVANGTGTTETLVVQPRPEAIVATKRAEETRRKQQARAKQQKANANRKDAHVIVRGDSLSKLSEQYNVPISAILNANNMSSADMLIAGDKIIIPNKKATTKRANNTTAKAEKKPAKQSGSNSARQVKPFYSVQVSLADNEAKANELAKKYRQAGYKVQTSKTSRGVRVLVGSASNAEEANKLKAKLDKDNRVNSGDAWVRRVETLNP